MFTCPAPPTFFRLVGRPSSAGTMESSSRPVSFVRVLSGNDGWGAFRPMDDDAVCVYPLAADRDSLYFGVPWIHRRRLFLFVLTWRYVLHGFTSSHQRTSASILRFLLRITTVQSSHPRHQASSSRQKIYCSLRNACPCLMILFKLVELLSHPILYITSRYI
jgi:hypothetical protein